MFNNFVSAVFNLELKTIINVVVVFVIVFQVVTEEPNKNYFSAFGAIRMKANAFMELIRSFTICHSRGPEYREGWVLRGFRIIGLVIPGIPAHCPQDYVNATRLGPSDIFSPTPN